MVPQNNLLLIRRKPLSSGISWNIREYTEYSYEFSISGRALFNYVTSVTALGMMEC